MKQLYIFVEKISFANNDRFIKVPAQIVRVTEDGIGVEFMKKTGA